MKRREFIAGLGSAAAWPFTVKAQQAGLRRIGVLMPWSNNDPEHNTSFAAFRRGLQELGWAEERNLQMDVRWAAGDLNWIQMSAKELVRLQPDAILSDTTPVTRALQRETRTIPIVFMTVSDPIGTGFVASLPQPGGNITGFSNHDGSIAGKWLQLFAQIAPDVKRVAMIFNPDMSPYAESYYQPFFQIAARSLDVEPIVAPVRNDAGIEDVISSLGRKPKGGLIVIPDTYMWVHRALIISLAASNNVPVVSNASGWVRDGGLLAYGPENADIFHRAAVYIDRILRGAKPADLPVQLPVKFELAVNVKIAEALGLTVPQSILLSADEVIE
jgi:putative tryptophan/tyrosine transport system substrate-binding protein